MKKTRNLWMILAVLLFAASCQNSDIDGGQVINDGKLNLTATIVTPDATRVTYDVDNETEHNVTPTWSVDDEIIGWDDQGQTFTFTVTAVDGSGNATLDAGSYVPGAATKLYAIYSPDNVQGDITSSTLAVNLGTQSGALDDDSPVLMCATAEITAGSASLAFENQTAIIGVTKFKLPAAATLTSISVDGLITSGTFEVDGGGNLVLTPAATPATATATGSWATGDGNICTTAIYFATLPTTSAKVALRASDGVNDYGNLASIAATDIAAGNYYYMAKNLGAPVADVNGVKYGAIEDAFNAANKATTDVVLTLLANCTTSTRFSINASGTGAVTLDLNGHDINTTNQIRVTGRTLTILDSSSATLDDQGKITTQYSGGRAIYVESAGKLYYQGGTISHDSSSYGTVIVTGAGSKGFFSGGKLISENYRALSVTLGATAELSGSVEMWSSGHTIVATESAKIDITGGTFLRGGTSGYNVVRAGGAGAVVNINGGVFNNTESTSAGTLIYASSDGGEIYVEGGYFVSSGVNPVGSNGTTPATGVAYVTGGCFNKPINPDYAKSSTDEIYTNILNPDAGTSATYPFTVSLAPNVATVTQSSYTWPHGSVESAFKCANQRAAGIGDATVTLQTDVDASSELSVSSDNKYGIALDLNGHTLSSTASPAITSASTFSVTDSEDGGELTTTGATALAVTAGEATVVNGSLHAATNAVNVSGGSLTIDGGHFYGEGAADIVGSGTIKVNSGYFRYDPATWVSPPSAATGGTYEFGGRTYNYEVGFSTIVATVNGKGYPTLAAAVAAAVAYAGTSATVTLQLQKNISHDAVLDLSHASKQIILDLNNYTLTSTVATFITTSKNLLITDLSLAAGGKITSNKSQVISTDSDHHGTIVVEKVLIACTYGPSGAPEYTDADRYVITCRNGTNMTIRDGARIDQYSSGKNQVCGIMLGGSSTLTIEDAEIVTFNRYAIYTNNSNAELNISGNSLMYSGKMPATYVKSVKTVSISGGYFYTNSDTETTAVVAADGSTQGKKVTITGGFYSRPLTNSSSLTDNAHCPNSETLLSTSSYVNNETGWTYTSRVLGIELAFKYAVNPASIP